MPVVVVEAGKVVQRYEDVSSVAQALQKYPNLAGADLHAEDYHPETLFDGTTWTIPVRPPMAPIAVTKLKLVRALRSQGKWNQVLGRINAAGADVREDWSFYSTIRRDDPFLAVFQLTNAELDAVFSEAATL